MQWSIITAATLLASSTIASPTTPKLNSIMKWSSFSAAMLLSSFASANTTSISPSCTTCYTKVTTLPVPTPCPSFNSRTCAIIDCFTVSTTVIPTKSCDIVSTVTQTCQTECSKTCVIPTTTITDTINSCVTTAPNTSCFTATSTTGAIPCPSDPACGYGGVTTHTETITRTSNPYCSFTPTRFVPPECATSCQTTTTVTETETPYITTPPY